MIISVTGHRKVENESSVRKETEELFNKLKPELVYTGMAIGFDTIVAEICVKLGIPFIAAVPFEGQERKWNVEDKVVYHNLLSKAKESILVSYGGFAFWKYQKRNEYLVDNADEMVAYFNGEQHGGTFNCLEYAKYNNITIHLIVTYKVEPL
jgi:uncharacterized phage-like protein YoqJ